MIFFYGLEPVHEKHAITTRVKRENDIDMIIRLQISEGFENSFMVHMVSDPSVKHLIHG